MKHTDNHEGHTTKFMKLYRLLKTSIEEGMYLSGSMLPTEMQLMEQYGLSRTTVRRAIAMLQSDGLIKVVQGRGAEVIRGRTKSSRPLFKTPYEITGVEKQGWNKEQDNFSSAVIDMVQADKHIAEKLQIPTLSNVYRVQRIKLCDTVPYAYVVSYISCEAAPGLDAFSGKVMWLSKQLHDHYHVEPLSATETVMAKASTFVEANLLRVAVGTPVMLVERVANYEKGIIEFTESYYNPEDFRLQIHMKGRPDYLNTLDPAIL